MCLLISKPANVTFNEEMLRDFYSRNQDGFGVMYSQDNKLHYAKALGSVGDWLKFYAKYAHLEACFHLRMQTHGDIDLTNCHPYSVFGFEGEEVESPLLLMHNGILMTGNAKDATKSDTWHYIRDYLRPMLKANVDFAFTPEFGKLIGKHIGEGNRFALMDASGRLQIVNKSTGVEYMGAWFSNTYAWSASKYIKDLWGGSYHNGYRSAYDDDDRYGAWQDRTYGKTYGKADSKDLDRDLARKDAHVPKSRSSRRRSKKVQPGGNVISLGHRTDPPTGQPTGRETGTGTDDFIKMEHVDDVLEMRSMIDAIYPENGTKDSQLQMLIEEMGVTRAYHVIELMVDQKIKPSMWEHLTHSPARARSFSHIPMKTWDRVAKGKFKHEFNGHSLDADDEGDDAFATADVALDAPTRAGVTT